MRTVQSGRLLVIAALATGVLLTASLYLRNSTIDRTNRQTCTRIHRLDVAVQALIVSAAPTRAELNRLSYYRDHPAERERILREARDETRDRLRILGAADCGKGTS